jgi:protein kinase C substrate 80K-H
MTAALKKKKALLVDAGRQQQEIEDHIMRLEAEIKGAEVKVEALETELKSVEDAERKVVRSSGKGKGKVNALAGIAKARVDELRDALLEVRQQWDETQLRLKELEDILSKFKIEYNPNFNDEGVKRAVRSWEDYAAREVTESINQARDRDLDEIAKADSESSGINWEHWENEEDGCNDADLSKLPTRLSSGVD